jgi:gluconate 2-dehydrogenase gamma chain
MTRRSAVKLAALGLAGGVLGSGGAALVTRLARDAVRPFAFFTGEEAATLITVCEQIIPRDDAPGATDAGVIHFIDRQLSGTLSRHRPTYRQGLAALRAMCRAQHAQPFEALSRAQQQEILSRLEAGDVPKEHWREAAPAPFFRLVVSHTMQAFYGPPRHGGNRGYCSYRMLGVDYPQIIGRTHARKVVG